MSLKCYWPAKYSTVPLFSCNLLVFFKAFINKLERQVIYYVYSHDVLAEAAALPLSGCLVAIAAWCADAVTASDSAESSLLSTVADVSPPIATSTDASPPIPSRLIGEVGLFWLSYR